MVDFRLAALGKKIYRTWVFGRRQEALVFSVPLPLRTNRSESTHVSKSFSQRRKTKNNHHGKLTVEKPPPLMLQ